MDRERRDGPQQWWGEKMFRERGEGDVNGTGGEIECVRSESRERLRGRVDQRWRRERCLGEQGDMEKPVGE